MIYYGQQDKFAKVPHLMGIAHFMLTYFPADFPPILAERKQDLKKMRKAGENKTDMS